MPGKLKVKILAAKNLPIMDRASDSTDAFVEVKFGNTTLKTEVYRKSLNPSWNSDWFRFEVDDEDLQDEPLQIRVLDHDTYSAHDAIGKVYIDLDPLLLKDKASMFNGWFPIYDTMHGIRGSLNLTVKIDLFSDLNRFKESSCGIQFYSTSNIPEGHRCEEMHGLVEELVVNDDPEYQWIDKIRSMRSSNEARQVQFSKLSGQLQRMIGLKASDLGSNAVIGYRQYFDLEGESGIVVRAIGTAVKLIQGVTSSQPHLTSKECPLASSFDNSSSQDTNSPREVRRSSDPLENSVYNAEPSNTLTRSYVSSQQSIEMLEYPFFTLEVFPHDFIKHLGGVVATRSVKLLDHIQNPDEPDKRNTWWTELRTEIRSHARALACHAVVGYVERTSICDGVIVLSASGTAAVVDLNMSLHSLNNSFKKNISVFSDSPITNKESQKNCSVAHYPYNKSSLPVDVQFKKCNICKQKYVPDMIFATIEVPSELVTIGKGTFIQARVSRKKKDSHRGEINAKEISDVLPFMEYELHRQLFTKIKLKGMNSLFGLQLQITIGEEFIVVIGTATAVFLMALDPPALPRLVLKNETEVSPEDLLVYQEKIRSKVMSNRMQLGLICSTEEGAGGDAESSSSTNRKTDDDESQEPDDKDELSLSVDNKDAFLLEIDDRDELHNILSMDDAMPTDGFLLCNTARMPGVELSLAPAQMFTQVKRSLISRQSSTSKLYIIFQSIIQSLLFKLRSLEPCCITQLYFDIDLPETNVLQITLTGMIHNIADYSTPDSCIIEMNIPGDIMQYTPTLITPLSYVPNATIVKYLGHFNFFIIRETTSLKQEGGIGGFVTGFVTEVLAICRAHSSALGGNAMVAYRITDCMLDENTHRNQSQCLINVFGDVVRVQYHSKPFDNL